MVISDLTYTTTTEVNEMRALSFLLALLLFFAIPFVASAQTPRIEGRVLVIFGEGVGNRNEAVIAGVEQALAGMPGVTVLIPRSRPYSLRDAELAEIEIVVEIYLAEVVSRDDQSINVSMEGISTGGTRSTIRVRLGLKFLRVLGSGAYLQFLGTGEDEGSANGMTYVSVYIPWLGSLGSSSAANLEAAAFRNAAAIIIGR